MWWLMITLHTVAATVCFGSGVYALSPARARQLRWLLPVFLWSLVGMTLFVIGAIAAHWSGLEGLVRVIFVGLVGLAFYMVYRGWRASVSFRGNTTDPGRYMDDIGFVLISLFNGFVIVAAMDLGAPGWAVGIGAVLAAVIGIRLIHRAKSHELNVSWR